MSNIKLYELLFDFSKQLVIGIESNIYKTMEKFIFDNFIINFQKNLAKYYYNDVYKALILDLDENITNKFIQIQQLFPHSFLCILDILFNLTLEIIKNINRKNYNTNSYDEFINSVDKEIAKSNVLDFVCVDKIISQHKCVLTDIKSCDPYKCYPI